MLSFETQRFVCVWFFLIFVEVQFIYFVTCVFVVKSVLILEDQSTLAMARFSLT